MNVKAFLIFRGHLSNQHQTTLIHNAKMVLKLFCHRLRICLYVSTVHHIIQFSMSRIKLHVVIWLWANLHSCV